MNLRDAIGLTDSSLWLTVRALQTGLVGITGYGLVTLDLALAANGFLPLLVSLTPEFVERRYGHTMGAGLALWIATAASLHAIGALGPYETVPGYDTITHTLTATLVAGVAYAIVEAVDESTDAVICPPKFRFLFIVIFVLAFGVLWEIGEFTAGGAATLFGGEEVLTQYGMRDTILDLVFDGLGAVAVALWGTGYFDGVATVLSRGVASVFGRQREES
jgi:hypothetical protein